MARGQQETKGCRVLGGACAAGFALPVLGVSCFKRDRELMPVSCGD